jgi:Cysteine-rich secretory protein family.
MCVSVLYSCLFVFVCVFLPVCVSFLYFCLFIFVSVSSYVCLCVSVSMYVCLCVSLFRCARVCFTSITHRSLTCLSFSTGHFTQLVWASSRQFGVGKARSRSGKVLVVAHYRPPGNISGMFQQNVLPPLPDYDAEMTSESGSESSTSRSTEFCT